MELLSRTERSEWAIVDEIYPPLRRFAAVVAPVDLEPDDLLQEALVSVLRSRRLSELDHPGAYLRKTVLNVAVSHNRRMGRRRRALTRFAASQGCTAVLPKQHCAQFAAILIAEDLTNNPADIANLVLSPVHSSSALRISSATLS